MKNSLIEAIFELPRSKKRLIQLCADGIFIFWAFFLALILRFDDFRSLATVEAWLIVALLIPFCLIVFSRLGFYNSMVRFISQMGGMRNLIFGIGTAWAVLMLVALAMPSIIPRSVPFIFFLLLLFAILGSRWFMRSLYLSINAKSRQCVLIYGAGQSGRQLMQSLSHDTDYRVMAMIDRKADLHRLHIGGVRVYAPDDLPKVVEDLQIDVILLAIPSASRAERAAIIRELSPLPVKVQTIPGIEDLVSGRAQVKDVREVDIHDLLGRDPVPADPDLLAHDITGKTVMVTGAGGSIGSELCRQILHQRPRHLILFELSEFALYSIDKELRGLITAARLEIQLTPLLGSVQNEGRLRSLFGRIAVDTVYHAAAYKHVPLVEGNVVEGIRNNVFGTLNLAEACCNSGVKAFILISTDKAVRSTNVMGASKRVAELICQALAYHGGGATTRFSMVRFGNVLNSSGSVIPLFKQQIADGGPVTVTDPNITRYFMTITEAASLVIQSGALAKGGDVFLLDMGDPVNITDLARQMISLSGFTPRLVNHGENLPAELETGEIAIRFTGLRPGEKLFEELLVDGTGIPTRHPGIVGSPGRFLNLDELMQELSKLRIACDNRDDKQIKEILISLPTDYMPNNYEEMSDVSLARAS